MTKLQKLLNGRNPTTGSGGGVGVPVGTSQVAASLAAAASLIVNNNNNVAATARSEPQQLDASQFVYQPTQYDVLFGRGKPYQGHAGNIRFHKIVDVHKPRYSKARRHEKTEIAEEIVQYIQNDGSNAGRFLRRVDGEEYWIEVTDTVARDKVSHALRGKPSSSGPGTKKRSSMSTATIKQKKSTTEPSKRSMKKVDTADATQDNKQKKLSSTPVVEMGPSELELELLDAAVRRRSINNALLASAAASGGGGGSLYPPSTASLLSKRPSLDLKSQLLASALLTDRQLLSTNIFNPQPLGSLQSLLDQAGGLSSSGPLNHALLFSNNSNNNNDPLLIAMNQLRRSSDSSFGGFYR